MTDFQRLNYVVSRPSGGIDNNWHVTDDGDTCVAHCYGFDHDIPTGKELAKRIAACLNYCSGIETSELVKLIENKQL